MKFLQKPKSLVRNNGVRNTFIVISFSLVVLKSLAQVEPVVRPPDTDIPYKADTAALPRNDTIQSSPDTVASDSIKTPPQSDIKTTIKYSAKDSIEASVDGKMIWLYGSAKIVYGEIELDAEEIVIDYGNNTLTAHGKRDSLGQRIGYPIFKNGSETYETKDIIYNYKTGRAQISEVYTTQGEGIIHVEYAFKNPKDELFSRNSSYTTCNLEHPHYEIVSSKSKAIPKDKIISGPFYMKFNDIPLPIGFLFGMFPVERESKSGIIFPSYGEERRRGFNLRNGGYFFDISDYIKLAITGDIYSKGSHALYVNSNYTKRYHYNGSFNFSYSKTKIGDEIENPQVTNDFRIAWTHSPQSKGNSRFAASVNAATSTFNKNNNLIGYPTDINSSAYSNISAKLNSRVSYTQKFAGTPFTLGVNGSISQDLQTRQVDLPFPNITLNMVNQYPFQKKNGETGPLDNLSIGYNMAASVRITNNLGRLSPDAKRDSIAPFNFENLSLFFRNARKGIKHDIPISSSHKLFKYFTISPSIGYNETWYFEKLNWRQEVQNGKEVFVADTLHEFNRISNYSFSAGLTTRVYGTYFFKRGNVKAIRHVINPSISFSYTPDFTTHTNYFQEFTDDRGTADTNDDRKFYKSRHEGFIYGGSTTGHSGSIGFGIGNNVEMKVQNANDSIPRKVMLLNNLSLNSSYNIFADSFNLAPISISANSNILDNKFNINLSASLDPYQYVKDAEGIERRINSYAWQGGRLGRITSATLAVSTNFNPKARDKEQFSREKIAKSDLPEGEKEFYLNNPDVYVDFEIPWSLRMNYSLSYRHTVNTKPTVTQSLQFSGDLSLSEKWKIQYSSGYDFESNEFTMTSVNIARDLHCWTMSLSWVPFGRFQSYFFTIRVKSSLLQDLKIERRKPFFDNF